MDGPRQTHAKVCKVDIMEGTTVGSGVPRLEATVAGIFVLARIDGNAMEGCDTSRHVAIISRLLYGIEM